MVLSFLRLAFLHKVTISDQAILKLVKMASDLLTPLSKPLRSMQVLTPLLGQLHYVKIDLVQHLSLPCIGVHRCLSPLVIGNRRILLLSANKIKIDFGVVDEV